MQRFSWLDEVPFPYELVWSRLRDKIEGIVSFVPELSGVDVLELVERNGKLERTAQWWLGEEAVPLPLRGLVAGRRTSWMEHSVFEENGVVRWRQWLPTRPDAVDVRGRLELLDEGEDTVVQLSGELIVRPEHFPELPDIVKERGLPAFEALVMQFGEPRFRQTVRAMERYLEESY